MKPRNWIADIEEFAYACPDFHTCSHIPMEVTEPKPIACPECGKRHEPFQVGDDASPGHRYWKSLGFVVHGLHVRRANATRTRKSGVRLSDAG